MVGSYPAAYLSLTEKEIPTLVKSLQNLQTEEDYGWRCLISLPSVAT
ncbi:hypothetical protein OH492_16695 [Vibrio chagasii]|nr:hypothetical protein [Vibrio chagasii]